VFNGPVPEVVRLKDEATEEHFVANWLDARRAEGVRPEEMAIFVRSSAQLDRGEAAAHAANLPFRRIDEEMRVSPGVLAVCAMPLAKGLEFRAVVLMACEEDVLPDPARIEAAADQSDIEDVYNSERQLLYVACTRARDRLLISSAYKPSEFLEDLRG
jgi:superfamily I DNA/RNA helicase